MRRDAAASSPTGAVTRLAIVVVVPCGAMEPRGLGDGDRVAGGHRVAAAAVHVDVDEAGHDAAAVEVRRARRWGAVADGDDPPGVDLHPSGPAHPRAPTRRSTTAASSRCDRFGQAPAGHRPVRRVEDRGERVDIRPVDDVPRGQRRADEARRPRRRHRPPGGAPLAGSRRSIAACNGPSRRSPARLTPAADDDRLRDRSSPRRPASASASVPTASSQTRSGDRVTRRRQLARCAAASTGRVDCGHGGERSGRRSPGPTRGPPASRARRRPDPAGSTRSNWPISPAWWLAPPSTAPSSTMAAANASSDGDEQRHRRAGRGPVASLGPGGGTDIVLEGHRVSRRAPRSARRCRRRASRT